MPGSTTRRAPPRAAAERAWLRCRRSRWARLACWRWPRRRRGAGAELLPPERAFSFSARPLDAATVEARFAIANGYYLYRDKLKLRLEPGALAAPPVLPPGKFKQDEFFGKVETYRGELGRALAAAGPRRRAIGVVAAESQGCADVGVCYPPQAEDHAGAAGRRAGPGPVVESAPRKKTWFK